LSLDRHVGTALFWTTRNDRIAAGRGWALATTVDKNGVNRYSVRRYTEGLVHCFANDSFALQGVRRQAGEEDQTALLALAILKASQEEGGEHLLPGEFIP